MGIDWISLLKLRNLILIQKGKSLGILITMDTLKTAIIFKKRLSKAMSSFLKPTKRGHLILTSEKTIQG